MYSNQTALDIATEEKITGICESCQQRKILCQNTHSFNEIITGIYNSYYKIG